MIETNRLRLRGWQADDLQFLDAILGDPEVMEFSDRGVLAKSDQATWLLAAQAPMRRNQLPGTLAIEQNNDGRVIGYVRLSRDLQRIGEREAELGFRLAKFAWGHGFATEAVKGIMDATSSLAGLGRIVAIVDPHNHRSVHVLKRIGMSYENEILFEGYEYPDHLYARSSKS